MEHRRVKMIAGKALIASGTRRGVGVQVREVLMTARLVFRVVQAVALDLAASGGNCLKRNTRGARGRI